jgi:hypothetical protein
MIIAYMLSKIIIATFYYDNENEVIDYDSLKLTKDTTLTLEFQNTIINGKSNQYYQYK